MHKISGPALVLLLFLAILLPIRNLTAQPAEYRPGAILLHDAGHFFHTGLQLTTRPFRFESDDWLKAGLVCGSTALLFYMDSPTRSFALRNSSAFGNALFSLDRFRLNYPMFIIGAGVYSWGFFRKNTSLRQTGLMALEAYVYAGLISGMFKIMIGRRRPDHGSSPFYFKPIQLRDRYQSLPSGHVITSFAVSTVLAKSSKNLYWKLFWYSSASLMGAARIYHNRHWLSDVFCGSILGYFIADYIVNLHNKQATGSLGLKSRFFFSVNSMALRIYF